MPNSPTATAVNHTSHHTRKSTLKKKELSFIHSYIKSLAALYKISLPSEIPDHHPKVAVPVVVPICTD